MHGDLDLNERFDGEVQRFAEQFGFDVMIVQDAYEQCLQPNRFTEGEYHDLKSDRKKIAELIRHLEKAKETSECFSSILKATYKIAEQLLKAGKKLFVVELDDKDPADMGFALFTNKIQEAQEFTFSSLLNLKLSL